MSRRASKPTPLPRSRLDEVLRAGIGYLRDQACPTNMQAPGEDMDAQGSLEGKIREFVNATQAYIDKSMPQGMKEFPKAFIGDMDARAEEGGEIKDLRANVKAAYKELWHLWIEHQGYRPKEDNVASWTMEKVVFGAGLTPYLCLWYLVHCLNSKNQEVDGIVESFRRSITQPLRTSASKNRVFFYEFIKDVLPNERLGPDADQHAHKLTTVCTYIMNVVSHYDMITMTANAIFALTRQPPLYVWYQPAGQTPLDTWYEYVNLNPLGTPEEDE